MQIVLSTRRVSALKVPACAAALLSLAACATAPTGSAPPMTLGARTSAPTGFLEFCERAPMQCVAARSERAGDEQKAASIKVEARRRIWKIVFKLDDAVAVSAPGASRAVGPTVVPRTSQLEMLPGFVVAERIETDLRPVTGLTPASMQHPLMVAEATDVRPVTVLGKSSPETTDDSADLGQAPASAVVLPLTPALLAQLNKVNGTINRQIAHKSDVSLYGAVDYWATPLDRGRALAYGDCEDYVLEKRRALVAQGVPEAALSIAIVTTAGGESHAVLLVTTDKGDLVLDSLSQWIVFWNKTGYRWEERQRAGAAFDWVKVGPGPIVVASAE